MEKTMTLLTIAGLISIVASQVTPQSMQSGPDQTSNQEQPDAAANCPSYQPVYVAAGLPAGPQGLQGVQGPQGLTGPAGDPGVPGHPGGQGLKGEQGQGSPGPKGELGQKGDLGERGPMGTAGKVGPRGVVGQKGDLGERGPMGAAGRVGPRGVVGQKGVKGDSGDQGIKGDRGDYTQPPISAFSAETDGDFTSRQPITFEREKVDIGNDFDHTTGIFTCRITGLYYFSFSFINTVSSEVNVYLQVNGANQAAIHIHSGQDAYDLYSQDAIVSLQQGDLVKLYAHSALNIESGGGRNIFNGYLIHAL